MDFRLREQLWTAATGQFSYSNIPITTPFGREIPTASEVSRQTPLPESGTNVATLSKTQGKKPLDSSQPAVATLGEASSSSPHGNSFTKPMLIPDTVPGKEPLSSPEGIRPTRPHATRSRGINISVDTHSTTLSLKRHHDQSPPPGSPRKFSRSKRNPTVHDTAAPIPFFAPPPEINIPRPAAPPPTLTPEKLKEAPDIGANGKADDYNASPASEAADKP